MRLTTVILIASLMQVSATTLAQKVTLSETNSSLGEVLGKMRKQSGYNFILTDILLKKSKPVNIQLKETDVATALAQIFQDQPLTFTISKQTVVIKEKTSTLFEKVNNFFRRTEVTGRVLDAKGNPLIGASIIVKSTGKMYRSDREGNFIIPDADPDELIEISYVGYQSKLIKAKKLLGNVILEINDSKLDEVQVIAYGTTTQRLSTGNISTLSAKDIANQPVGNPLLTLAGRIPGLEVNQLTGIAGGSVTVKIQGTNSILSDNDPLYVIDGTPYPSQVLPTLSSVLGTVTARANRAGSGSPLSYLNPADIESISVLKDADATSIYGARAANGAILITTKRGRSGKTNFNLDLTQGFGTVGHFLDLMNTEQYLNMRRKAMSNDGFIPSSNPQAPRPQIYSPDLTSWGTGYTDWQKELIGGTAKYQDIQAGISGGNENTRFSFSGNYHRETTVMPGDLQDQKGSFRMALDHNSTDHRFNLKFTGSYLLDNNQLSKSDLTQTAIRLAPNTPTLFNPDGSLNWALNELGMTSFQSGNPATDLVGHYQNKTNNLLSNLSLGYNILENLNLKVDLGYNQLSTREFQTSPLAAVEPFYAPNTLRFAYYSDNVIRSGVIEPQLSYKKSWGKHKLETFIGTSYQQRTGNGERLTGRGFASDAILSDLKSATLITVTSTDLYKYRYGAIFARINYNINDKYILNLNARRDGSSRFGNGNQFHNFGSVGLAWVFSEEGWLKNSFQGLSFGKLHASYGTTGNDQIQDYAYLSTYSPQTTYQGSVAYKANGHANPYIQWEETKKLNIGADLGFLKDRIVFSANYSQNRSSNQLFNITLPIATGFTFIRQNLPATVQNRIWEFAINSSNIKGKNFSWQTSFNLSLPKNKLLNYENFEQSSLANTLVLGESLSVLRTYKYAGVDPNTGKYQFWTADGKLTFNPDYAKDRTVNINRDSKMYGGIQNVFTYKNLELNVFFQFNRKKDLSSYKFGLYPGASQFNQPTTVLDNWSNVADMKDIQRYSYSSDANNAYSNLSGSDVMVESASFIRLKNVALSWRLPSSWIQGIKLNSMSIFAQGQNLITWTNYSGLDPETGNAAMPPLRLMTFGARIGL